MSIRLLPILLVLAGHAHAGPFAPAANQDGTTAISAQDPRVVRWANTVRGYVAGDDLSATWQDTTNALGPAEGNPFDIVALGRGGQITLEFDPPVTNNPGPDLAVFENSFSHTFLEFAFVEVSSDGITFVRFPSFSETPGEVGPFSSVDPTNVSGLAGKYIAGFGTPFDLDDLPETAGVNPNEIRFLRLIDVVGGTSRDSLDRIIYDPFPTTGSAGFDLDAVAQLGPASIRILSTEIDGGSFAVTWQSVPGVAYTLQTSADPSGPWTSQPVVIASQDTQTGSLPVTGVSAKFVRIRVSPQG